MIKKMIVLKTSILLAVFCFMTGLSCHADGGKNNLVRPKYWPLTINGYLYDKIELAITQEEQIRGLMERDKVEETGGMLFVSDIMTHRTFWMKNCRVDMDLIYMDSKGIIVSLHHMHAERLRQRNESEEAYYDRLPTYESGKPVQFVLELASGQIDFLGLQAGDKIELGTHGLLELYKKFK